MDKKLFFRAILLVISLAASMTVAIGFGSVEVETSRVIEEIAAFWQGNGTNSSSAMIIFDIRLPRIIFAAISGANVSLQKLWRRSRS